MLSMLDLIEAKKSGLEHAPAQVAELVRAFAAGEVPDYQMAAWLMAVRWRGLSIPETTALTEAFVASGTVLDLIGAGLPGPFIDKHSTGGVGDKLSLVVVPLLIAAGATVVKLSGAGLGHTGGTVDKLAAIPGMRLLLGREEILRVARLAGGCLAAQSAELVPADGLVYALRDVTATVDSLPLIAASVMAKKIACGAATIALDIKVGGGAFMRSRAEAAELASRMIEVGTRFGRRTVAMLTAMDQPLGRAVGNAIEVNEAVEVLEGGGPPAVRRLSLAMAAHALAAATERHGLDRGADDALRARLTALLDSGAALDAFVRLVAAQGGDTGWLAARREAAPARLGGGGLPLARHRVDVASPRSGALAGIEALSIGRAAVRLGAGRSRKGEAVDPGAGVLLQVGAGDNVERGQPVAELFSSDPARFDRAVQLVLESLRWLDDPGGVGCLLPPGEIIAALGDEAGSPGEVRQ